MFKEGGKLGGGLSMIIFIVVFFGLIVPQPIYLYKIISLLIY